MDTLATVGELELHLQREFADQAAAELALALSSGAVRAYCGWNISQEETTFEVDGDGSRLLSLPTLLLLDLVELWVDDELVDPLDTQLWPQWSKKGQLYRRCGWKDHSVIHARVLHGHNPVPDLVKLVALDLASKNTQNPEGLVSATVGQVSKTWAGSNTGTDNGSLPALHSRLLDRYAL
ncbi:MAG: hypothetical protein ABW022_04895 [Actinoplanes sp.]